MDVDEKECPFCAEIIKAKAKVCKHCGKDLSSEDLDSITEMERAPSPKKTDDKIQQSPTKKEPSKKDLAIGCGCLIVIAVILVGVIAYLFGGSDDEDVSPASASAASGVDTANSKISDPIAATAMINQIREDMHAPDLAVTANAFDNDSIEVSVTFPDTVELSIETAVDLSDAVSDSIKAWRRSTWRFGDAGIFVNMYSAEKDAKPKALGKNSYVTNGDFSEWASAPGQPEGKTEDQLWREKEPSFKKAVLAIFSDGSIKDIDVKITEFTPRNIFFSLVLPRPLNSMDEAEICGKGAVITAVQWAVAEDHNPSVYDMGIRGSVTHPETSVTGNEVVRWYGTARYSDIDDQVTWSPAQ